MTIEEVKLSSLLADLILAIKEDDLDRTKHIVNDINKKKLAVENGIEHYFEVDCRLSMSIHTQCSLDFVLNSTDSIVYQKICILLK